MNITKPLLLALLLLAAVQASATDATVYSLRQDFNLASGARVRDTFEHPDYRHVMSDAAMGAVLGETEYFTYGGNIVDYNNIMPGFGVGGSQAYCSLCYGSFRLSFENSSLAVGGGIHGIGVDITANGGAVLPYRYAATVSFVDGATEVFDLPHVAESFPAPPDYRFWGITAPTGIRSIDFVSHSSLGPERTYLIIDNLTLAAAPVPEGSTFALMLVGLGLLAGVVVRRARRVAARGRTATTRAARRLLWAGGLAGAIATTGAQGTPLALAYAISPAGGGNYRYDFHLTLDNHDASWTQGMNFNWIVFGDGFPASTLDDFVGDPASLLGGPFSEFTTSGGGNNGPTLLDHTPTVETGGWIPAAVGERLSWSGMSRRYVGAGRLLFSNAQGSPHSPAYFEVAQLLPVPEAPVIAMHVAGLMLLAAVVRRRRSAG